MYELRETNMMVEEMMLMANITVGTHIHRSFPSCAILRRHEPPTPEMFAPLMQARACFQWHACAVTSLWKGRACCDEHTRLHINTLLLR